MIPLIAKGLAKGATGALTGSGRSGSAGFKMSADMEMDPGSLEKFRIEFGDTSNQALLRIAVSVSRECAFFTQPRGKGKKKIVDAINKGALLNIYPLPAKEFKKHANSSNPAFFANERWYKLKHGQILRSEDDIWNFIEKSREGSKRGRPKWLHPSRKAICKKSDMSAVLKRRRKLAGIAKGSWLGAFKPLSLKIKGGDKPRLGKNYMSWAQKHADKGRARWSPSHHLRVSQADLISEAPATKSKRIFSDKLGKRAVNSAWKKTTSWYEKQCKLKFDKGART